MQPRGPTDAIVSRDSRAWAKAPGNQGRTSERLRGCLPGVGPGLDLSLESTGWGHPGSAALTLSCTVPPPTVYCIGGHRPEGAQAGESGQEKRQADVQPCPTRGRPRGGRDACRYLHLTGDVWRPDGVTEPESTPDLTPCTHSASQVRDAHASCGSDTGPGVAAWVRLPPQSPLGCFLGFRWSLDLTGAPFTWPRCWALLQPPQPPHPGGMHGIPSAVKGAASVRGGGKVYPLNEAPVCTAEEGGLGEGEARLLPPPHHSEPQTSIPEQPPP